MCRISERISNNKMNSKSGKGILNVEHLREKLKSEHKFITSVLDRVPFLYSQDADNDDSEEEGRDATNEFPGLVKKPGNTTRAHTIEELQERLEVLKAKKKQSPKELAKRKNLEAKLKNKKKKDDKVVRPNKSKKQDGLDKHKFEAQQNNGSLDTSSEQKPSKPVFNSEGKMVFSKFDFSDIGTFKDLKKKKKEVKDPKKILEKLKEKKETLKKLKEEGEEAKAQELLEKEAWSKALKKAGGVKVRDDPELLIKTLKRKETQKKSSAKKWASRKYTVNKSMKDKSEKREANIQSRKDAKKQKKRTKAIKKGRLVPGF